ncbi:MAG: cytochrome c biogenesis protein CcdA [Alphaproteobacteria bacterium]
MEFTLTTAVLLPVGLGLLGFIEPCTIGAHLIYLRSQARLTLADQVRSLVVFVLVRAVVAGVFGAVVALLGHKLIGVQTTLWLVFGVVYLVIAIALVTGRPRFLTARVGLAPKRWRETQGPVLLGLAFGLNIPACAAPILFGLLGLAASVGAVAAGFWMMFLFGLSLSLPLALFLLVPRFTTFLESLHDRARGMRLLIGLILGGLGIWSIWFGLFVDPANWAGQ